MRTRSQSYQFWSIFQTWLRLTWIPTTYKRKQVWQFSWSWRRSSWFILQGTLCLIILLVFWEIKSMWYIDSNSTRKRAFCVLAKPCTERLQGIVRGIGLEIKRTHSVMRAQQCKNRVWIQLWSVTLVIVIMKACLSWTWILYVRKHLRNLFLELASNLTCPSVWIKLPCE